MGMIYSLLILLYLLIGALMSSLYLMEENEFIGALLMLFFWLPIMLLSGVYELVLKVKQLIDKRKRK